MAVSKWSWRATVAPHSLFLQRSIGRRMRYRSPKIHLPLQYQIAWREKS